jgi:hypothetical protein
MALDDVAFTHRGRTFHCRIDMGGESGSALARPSEAVWVVEVDGKSYAPLDASPDDTRESLVHRVISWFDRVYP